MRASTLLPTLLPLLGLLAITTSGCRRESPRAEGLPAASTAPLAAPSSPLPATSAAKKTPHPALAEIAKLPEVVAFGKQDRVHDGDCWLDRLVRPTLTEINEVAPDCEGDACLLVVDVTDEGDVGAAQPEYRFYVHTKTRALFIEGRAPYPEGRLTYEAWTVIERQRVAHEKRIRALPEVRAQARYSARPENQLPGCRPTLLDVRLAAVPSPDCVPGELDCRWRYDLSLPNGCTAHNWQSFFIDPKTQALSVSDTVGYASLPYATWHARGGRW